MVKPFLSHKAYWFFFCLLGLVYFCGLFVPLMDNDSAHHANIALRMYLTGDYVSLVDHAGDYLDKPHLHFWLCALSYKVFGVTSFAYKFPSFLFTILGTWSTYRLGKSLYNEEVGRLASLILASSFAYLLANNDVRMDALLTSFVAFATWQLVEFINTRKLINVAGAALGLALGFSTKGHIAVFIPAVSIFFYILYRKEGSVFLNPKWLLLLLFFILFISPVLYCYYLQFNLNPEKTVRGKNNINGVQFILFNQSIERFSGKMGGDSGRDYFFFLHSFLWVFAPWSLLAYMSLARRIKDFTQRKKEWLTTGGILAALAVISFSGFKLPHYLNIVFPAASVLVAEYILHSHRTQQWINRVYRIQGFVSGCLLLVACLLSAWVFPLKKTHLIILSSLLLSVFFYFLMSRSRPKLQGAVSFSVLAITLTFFLLNTHFYPSLLKYQGGNELAFATKKSVPPQDVFFWKNTQSASYCFYTLSLRKQFSDSLLYPGKTLWLLYDIREEPEIRKAYRLGKRFEVPDFEITKLDLNFIDPNKRDRACTQLILSEITK